MWAQERKLEAACSKRARWAKRAPADFGLAALAVGIALCPVAVAAKDFSSAPLASPEHRRTLLLLRRHKHPVVDIAGLSTPRATGQDPHGSAISGGAAPTRSARPPCDENLAQGRRAVELSPSNDLGALALARELARCGQDNEAVTHYRHYLQTHPQAEDVLAELGDTLLRAQQAAAALEVFRDLLRADPGRREAHLGLARALARRGNYAEASQHYEAVLNAAPGDYDALQGKAFLLYWNGQLEPAKALFQRLLTVQPSDLDNLAALQHIEDAQEETRWRASRPAPNAPPQAFLPYYEERLARCPDDLEARRGLARAEAQLHQAPAAIQQYKRLLESKPTDRGAQMELARLLSADVQYEEAAKLYQSVLAQAPEDASALEGLAYVWVKLKRWQQARPLFETLAGKQAERVDYQVELARVDMNLKDYAAAREVLVTLLSTHPREQEARAQLAQVELEQNHFRNAARQFDLLLKQDLKHVGARLGRARVAYYLNDLSLAHRLAAGLVAERPEDFDAIFLLAQVEQARRHRARALHLVQQAKQLAPNDPETAQLEKRINQQANFRLRTTASYAREMGQPSALGHRSGTGSEDLRLAGFGTTLEFAFLPRTTSYLSLAYLPSNSPAGGVRGAVGPAQWLYRQDTQLTSRLILRGGAGLVRLGPGRLENVPRETQPIATATIKPLGFGGLSYAPTPKYSLDLEAARNPILYTPTSVRLGTMENRFTARLNYFFHRRTELHFEYFFATYASILYNHVRIVNYSPVRGLYADHDQAHGGTVTFVHNVRRGERFRWDAGYEGTAYGYAGARRQVWLGFFNPSFYQRHQFTSHVVGKIWKPLGYDFTGGIGLQQIEQGQALTRALTLSPALTYQVNKRLTLGLGYTHYNSAQTLGALHGDAVRLTTEWSF